MQRLEFRSPSADMDPNQQQPPQQIPNAHHNPSMLPQQSIHRIQEPTQLSQPPSMPYQPSGHNRGMGMVNAPVQSSPYVQPGISLLQPAGLSVICPNSNCAACIQQFPWRIEELRRMLLVNDREVIKRSASFIYSIVANQPNNARLLVQNPHVIDAVVAAMVVGRVSIDRDLIKSTLGVLYWISDTADFQHDGCEVIARSGAIPHLVALLSFDFDPMYTMTVICNLLSYHASGRLAFRSFDTIQSFVRLLERNNEQFLVVLTDCLSTLAQMDAETRLTILKCNAHIHLIRILNSASFEKLLCMTAYTIMMLCNCQHNKRAIIKSGGIQVLTKHLSHESHQVVLTCLNALRNLSDIALFAKDVDRLLDGLVLFLGCGDREALDFSPAILYNLTCKNSRNKKRVCERMGIESMNRVLIEHWSIPSIVEITMSTLSNLTRRCSKDVQTWRWGMEAQTSLNKLRQLGCLPLIGRYLDLFHLPPEFLQYPEAMCEALLLLRNLAMYGGAWWPDYRHYRIVEATANLVCQVRWHWNELVGDRLHFRLMYTRLLGRALQALSVLCQCEENRRILLGHAHIRSMANEVFNLYNFAYVKDAASEFLEALRAPYRDVAVAPIVVGMNNMVDNVGAVQGGANGP